MYYIYIYIYSITNKSALTKTAFLQCFVTCIPPVKSALKKALRDINALRELAAEWMKFLAKADFFGALDQAGLQWLQI